MSQAERSQDMSAIPVDRPHELNEGLTRGLFTRSQILRSISLKPKNSLEPLAALESVLRTTEGPWPVLELQQTYTSAWKRLPEEAKSCNTNQSVQGLLMQTLLQCKQSYSSLLDLIYSDSDVPVIIDPDTNRSVTHRQLAAAVRRYGHQLSTISQAPKAVVAISLPNGPLLAMTVFATAAYWTAAPVAHGNGVGKEQFKSDVLLSNSTVVVARAEDVDRLDLRGSWTTAAGITVVLVELTKQMELVMRDLDGKPLSEKNDTPRKPSTADDTGILLFTSGTSGTKKLVPVSIHSIVCGVAMVVESWGLSPTMRCLNQMPLHHVGGIVRNLFAPILSGGSVICCGAFDANQFWDCVDAFEPTWYYASPSMHQAILEAGRGRPESLARSRLRLVCNAAGALLPSLARELQQTFSNSSSTCVVLPSYGMTECMPISTPPLNYQLERTGTSGISVGPEISIRDGNSELMKSGIGRVCVRGPPVFSGYLKPNGVVDTSCFDRAGWFDTGDMGYMDDDAYLYITGRSKEVINRGGELISPMEVEEAIMIATQDPKSPTYQRINKALAFSITHDKLEEVVGIAIVTSPGQKRPCLRKIQESIKPILSQVKLPVAVVYMEGGVPTNNNKILRINLAKRLGLSTLNDNASVEQRHFEATCPPPNTALSVPIACEPLRVSYEALKAHCLAAHDGEIDVHIMSSSASLYPELVLTPSGSSRSFERTVSEQSLIDDLSVLLHSYELPSKIHILQEILPRNEDGTPDEMAIKEIISRSAAYDVVADFTPVERTIANIFVNLLSVPLEALTSSSDFFDIGGDSLKAGRLLFLLRQTFSIKLPIEVLFSNSRISALALLVSEKMETLALEKKDEQMDEKDRQRALPGCERTCSSTNPFVLFIQLIPLLFIYPMKRSFTWTVFMYCLTYSQRFSTNNHVFGRLLDLVVSMAIGRVATKCVAPVLAITVKWLVIGSYREGIYPMWSFYHTRWWFCQKVISMGGKGMFGCFNWSRVLYFRLLGARIGSNVTITQGATLGEYDLVNIEDDVVLERCIVRPFGAERNTSMYLGAITIGRGSTIGLGAVVAPGACLRPNTCLGPNSSSWEADDATEENRLLAASKVEGAHWLLVLLLGIPVQLSVRAIGGIPWAGALLALVRHAPSHHMRNELRDILLWFASPDRVALHYGALAANAWLGPVFVFLAVFIWKKLLGGRITSKDLNSGQPRSQWTRFRMHVSRAMMPAPQFHKLTELFGTHYGATSVFARALGAKVGHRVYWPGTGPSWQDIDLIDIGNDVVFGSRSHIVTSDGSGSSPVRIADGAMIADRVVLLPGVEVGNRTVMGSGALTRRDRLYPDDTTWVGSKNNEAVCLSGRSSSALPSATIVPRIGSIALNQPFGDSQDTVWDMSTKRESKLGAVVRPLEFSIGSSATSERTAVSMKSSGDSVKSLVKDGKSSSRSSFDEKSSPEQSNVGSSPFGRAFYLGMASYRVWSQWEITLYSTLTIIVTAVFWNVGSISATQAAGRLFRSGSFIAPLIFAKRWYRPLSLYTFFWVVNIAIMLVQSICVLAFLIAAKWVLLGRRKPGNYDWDKSSYCQRWQLFLKLESLRRKCYGGVGILGLLTGTHWIVLYFRALGATIGKDCALFAGGKPSLYFTEPELLTLGDRVAIDDASLVCHINSRGKFDLNPLFVGDRSVLRSGSRLLSGARMEADSCLLEHTLIMAGDIVDSGTTKQGWPASDFTKDRAPTLDGRLASV